MGRGNKSGGPDRLPCGPAHVGLILLGLLALGGAARGDEVVQAASAPSLPRARLEVGYMADWRVDSQSMGSMDVSASGLNPGGLRAAGAVFFGDLPVGLAANFGWERFSLTCDPADPKSGCQGAGPGEVKLTAIGIDFSGGLAGRINIAGWGLEGELGWGYRRLPVVDSATAAQLRAGSVSHHGPMLALRFGGSIGNVFLPDVHFAAVPYTFSATARCGWPGCSGRWSWATTSPSPASKATAASSPSARTG